ncbi:MAG TPA: hypothetical protein VM509_13580, partial [Planctomycetota bacterium]|nr:hypothetical protein [Planctomycetota bacterium]
FDRGSEKFRASKSKLADIPDELRARLQQVAIAACRALKVRDYARVDLRLTEAGEIYVLEVNANCYLEEHDEFPVAAKAAGIGYEELIGRIVKLAMERARIARPAAVEEQPLTDAP